MKNIWNLISNMGISKDLDDRLIRKIRLTNQISFTAGLVVIFVSTIPYIEVPFLILVSIISGLIYCLPILINYYRKYNLSRFFLLISAVVILVLLGSLETDLINTTRKFEMMSVILVPLMLFDVSERLKMYKCRRNFETKKQRNTNTSRKPSKN